MKKRKSSFLYFLRMTLQNLSLNLSLIHISIKIWKTASVDADGNPCIKECPKTEAGNRILPLKPELKAILQDYLSSDMCSKGVYLFEKRGGGFLTEASHRRIMESVESKFKKTFLETASKETLLQIPEPDDLTYYRLRHTFITRLWYEGVDVKDAQYLAGHENVQLTLDEMCIRDRLWTIHRSPRRRELFRPLRLHLPRKAGG